jgi:hypothetical protein
MAILLILIIGATVFFSNGSSNREEGLRPRDLVMFNDIYDYPEPTPGEVLQTLVAVEERENGR